MRKTASPGRPNVPNVPSGRHLFAAVLAAFLAVGCGGRGSAPPPTAGTSFGRPPNLQGAEVMVLPVQGVAGIASALQPESEIVFALRDRGSRVGWIFPDELRETVARSPALELPLERLPVRVFLQAEVRRVGDPLYGHLRRLAAIAGVDLALIPIAVRHRPETPEREAGIEIAAALVRARSGHVLWFAMVDGEPGSGDDPSALASAADALARAVVW